MRRSIRDSTVTLKHIQTVRRGGKVHRYLRIPGKVRVKLPDMPPDSPEFLAAYAEALKAAPRPQRAATGTIGALTEVFLRSDRFLALSPGYRHMMRVQIDAIRRQAGGARLSDLMARHIRADLAPLAPHLSSARVKAWRLLCQFAIEAGLATEDPSAGIKAKRAPKTDGHPPWTAPEIEAFRARWPCGTTQRLAMELLLWTGARISDAVRLGPGMVGRDGVLVYRQKKTGEPAYAPWTCAIPRFAEAPDELRAALAARPSGHMTFLATAAGRTRSDKAFGGFVREAARTAGVVKSAHGLRKCRAAMLAEGGATEHEIAAWTGHTSLSEVQHYIKSANRRSAVIGTEQDRNSVNTADPFTKTAI